MGERSEAATKMIETVVVATGVALLSALFFAWAPRCPECGFVFTWAELIQGQREGHKYLFEHHPKRNVWSFWKTYWSDWLAARFWMDVNPAQPVRLRRWGIF